MVETLEDRLLLSAPTAYDDWQTTPHDQALAGTVFADDVDGDPLTYFEDSAPLNGDLTFDSDGWFIYTPDPAFMGSDSFTWHAFDGTSNSNIATLYIDVINTAPVASDHSFSTLHDVPLSDTVAWDAQDDDGDALTFSLDAGPANGDLVFNPDGSFTYTPDPGFTTATGPESFTWHATDGIDDSNVATADLNVYNFAPQAYDGWYSTDPNVQPAGDWDLNDESYDEDADPLTFTVQTLPTNGTLYDFYGSPLSAGQSFDGLFVYIEDEGFTGGDSFTFSASDGIDESGIATIHIDVPPDYNAGPLVANDDVAITERDTPTNIDVLDNDGSWNGLLTITDVTQGLSGTVTFDASSVTYTPDDPTFTGHDTFQYQVEDEGIGMEPPDSTWATVDVYVVYLDLDVDNDGSLGGANDGADNYLPGYVGQDPVLSTQTTFNQVQYLGQQMQIIVEGIGSDAQLSQVEFELIDVTSYEGYSGNTSDPAIEGSGKDKDFAFAQGANQSLFVATGANIEPTRSWAPLWAKDYGAEAAIAVTLHLGAVNATLAKTAPTDTDADKLPDLWEKLEVAKWEREFGISIVYPLTWFNEDSDKEPKDPDGSGTNFWSPGDNDDLYLKDIRAAGTPGTIYVEFSNDIPASGLSVLTVMSGNDRKIYVELADDGTNITSTALDVQTALNNDPTASTLVSAGPHEGDGSGVVSTVALTKLGPLPAHKTAGDSLTAKQEQRGFHLDGGGFAIKAQRMLSPVRKELLVEVDIMASVPAMPNESTIRNTVLPTVSKGFSDENTGAGIDMYWVISETAATHDIFANDAEANAWAAAHRDPTLKKEFVHLMFTDSQAGDPYGGGTSDPNGSFIFVTTKDFQHTKYFATKDFTKMLARTAAHELTHLLLDTAGANGFAANEHVTNPDPSDPAGGPKDLKYLMYQLNTENVDVIIFSDVTMAQLDLTKKESVERLP